VRGDLIRTLHGLLARPGHFDAVIVETTGLADPGPVAQTFFVDAHLRAQLRLDSITTLVDARHITRQLADSREAAEQIGFADQIVLNKTDLATEVELQALERQLRRLNPLAPIHRALRSAVALDTVLGRGGFDLDRIVALEPAFLRAGHGEPGHVHDEHCGHDRGAHDPGDHHVPADPVHDGSITSVSLTSTQPMDAARVQAWLTQLVAAQGADILRAKGIIDVAGDPRRLVFQAVHMLLEGDSQRPWRADEVRSSRLVFIGRRLDAAALQAAFEACAAA
jgi:G3E family GTPase